MGTIIGQARLRSRRRKNKFKPIKIRLKIDLVSNPARAEKLVNIHIRTDHKPLMGAFQLNSDGYSSREIIHLDNLMQLTSDIRFLKGRHIHLLDPIHLLVSDLQMGKWTPQDQPSHVKDILLTWISLQLFYSGPFEILKGYPNSKFVFWRSGCKNKESNTEHCCGQIEWMLYGST